MTALTIPLKPIVYQLLHHFLTRWQQSPFIVLPSTLFHLSLQLCHMSTAGAYIPWQNL